MVEPKYIMPSTGVCYNVLLTAARAGNVRLAVSVIRLLSYRQGRPMAIEYQLLSETCLMAGDVDGELHVRKCMESEDSGTYADLLQPFGQIRKGAEEHSRKRRI